MKSALREDGSENVGGGAVARSRALGVDLILTGLGLCAAILVAVILSLALWSQHSNYMEGVRAAIDGKAANYGAVLALSRGWDFAIAKTAALFLGFLLVFVGALYVLRTGETRFSLMVEAPALGKGSLISSSPGLVLSTLGVVLVIVVVLSKTALNYQAPGTPAVGESPSSAEPTPAFDPERRSRTEKVQP